VSLYAIIYNIQKCYVQFRKSEALSHVPRGTYEMHREGDEGLISEPTRLIEGLVSDTQKINRGFNLRYPQD
jgi:hypothetical protein